MLKKLSTAIALGLVVGALSIPAASFAGKGVNSGDGVPNCSCGELIDGVCYPYDLLGSITPKGNFDVAAGNKTGDQDGTGPDQDRLQDGSCLDNELSTQGNFDVAANGNQTGDLDGTGPDQDRLRDGSCLDNELSTQGNFDVAANGNQTGDLDGTGPDQDRLRDGSCLDNELSTQGNFDVAKGPKGDGIPNLECAEGEDSLNPACWDAISTQGKFDVAANGNQTGDLDGTGPDQDRLRDGSCLDV